MGCWFLFYYNGLGTKSLFSFFYPLVNGWMHCHHRFFSVGNHCVDVFIFSGSVYLLGVMVEGPIPYFFLLFYVSSGKSLFFSCWVSWLRVPSPLFFLVCSMCLVVILQLPLAQLVLNFVVLLNEIRVLISFVFWAYITGGVL